MGKKLAGHSTVFVCGVLAQAIEISISTFLSYVLSVGEFTFPIATNPRLLDYIFAGTQRFCAPA